MSNHDKNKLKAKTVASATATFIFLNKNSLISLKIIT